MFTDQDKPLDEPAQPDQPNKLETDATETDLEKGFKGGLLNNSDTEKQNTNNSN